MYMLKKSYLAAALATALVASAPTALAVTESDVDAMLASAEVSLAEAEKLKSVWSVWVDGVGDGSDSSDLGEILATAKERRQAGKLDDAMRLAQIVDDFARAGAEQAKRNQQF